MAADTGFVHLKQLRHLAEGKPDSLALQPDFNSGFAVLSLIQNQLAFNWTLLVLFFHTDTPSLFHLSIIQIILPRSLSKDNCSPFCLLVAGIAQPESTSYTLPNILAAGEFPMQLAHVIVQQLPPSP